VAGIERSLAFTALLEHDAEFGAMDMNQGSARIDEFMRDWENAGKPQMFEFGREWVAERKAPAKTGDTEAAERQTFGALRPNGNAEEYVYLPAEPDERQVMEWAEHNAEVDSQELPDREYGE
jgi:hypothetical protein